MFERPRNYSQAQLILKKKVVACRKILFFQNQTHVPPQKTRVVRFQTARKILENIRNSASNLYWWSVQDPYRDVFEAGGSTCKKVS